MPIEVNETIRVFNQQQFGEVAFEVMDQAFRIHNELGRFCDEDAYQHELEHVLDGRANREVWINVRHGDFCKKYYMDLLVDHGALFELKTVDQLMDEHRAQLLNYLLLTGLHHGKLINFRPERVEHEFVNTTLSHPERVKFEVDDADWHDGVEASPMIRRLTEELLRDWGTGLDIHLYEEALTHFLGGAHAVHRETEIVNDGRRIGIQFVRLAGPDAIFKITALSRNLEAFESHARRFLKHTALRHILWINVTLHRVTFRTLSK